MIRFILFAILCYILYRLIKGLTLSSPQQPDKHHTSSRPTITDEMVIDPACQVYIPKREAIAAQVRGETIYFCSQECMKKYFQNTPGQGSADRHDSRGKERL